MTQVIVQKLSDSDSAKAGVLQYADHIMDALLNVFACRKTSVHEEAMLAVVSWAAGVVLGRPGSVGGACHKLSVHEEAVLAVVRG